MTLVRNVNPKKHKETGDTKGKRRSSANLYSDLKSPNLVKMMLALNSNNNMKNSNKKIFTTNKGKSQSDHIFQLILFLSNLNNCYLYAQTFFR